MKYTLDFFFLFRERKSKIRLDYLRSADDEGKTFLVGCVFVFFSEHILGPNSCRSERNHHYFVCLLTAH